MNELYSRGLHHGSASYEIGDTTLQQERAYNSALSMRYEGHGKFNCELGVYYNYIEDFIYQEPVQPATLTIRGAFPTFRYKQVDARFAGVDAAFAWNVADHLRWTGKASIVRAQNLSLDLPLIQIPADRFESGLSYEFHGGKYVHEPSVSVGGVFTRHQNRYPAGVDYADPPPAWFLLNAEVAATVVLGHFTMDLSLGGYNLTNTRYREYMNRFRYYADEMGRNISLRIRIPFAAPARSRN